MISQAKKTLSLLWKPFAGLNPAEATVLSFIAMSLIGGLLLWHTESDRLIRAKQPVIESVSISRTLATGEISTTVEGHTFTRDIEYRGEKFIDTLFTAVSALCVTGLISTDFSTWTLTGQIITMILIQMGGLGIILFTSYFAMLIVRGISERETFKVLLAGILDVDGEKLLHMARHVLVYTIFFEGFATIIMGLHLNNSDPALLGGANPWWWALFHSVSAFNNAGFGLLNNNLMNFALDPVINLTIAGLIITGGLGYPVLIAIHAYLRRFFVLRNDKIQRVLDEDVAGVVASSVQTRVAIVGTLLLLAIGTFFMYFAEIGNPIMQNYSPLQQFMAAFFQSVSTRTAGFNTVDIGALHVATLFVMMGLMYIGANPAGTAGGIKIPTLAVLYGYIKDWFLKPGEPVRLFGRSVSKFAVSHAVRLYFFSTLAITVITLLICIAESQYLITPDPTFNFLKVAFEVVSAFGTVGLSMGFAGSVTSFSAILSPFSKFLIILTMLFGRLGPLTVLAALPWKRIYAKHPPSQDFDNVEKIQIG